MIVSKAGSLYTHAAPPDPPPAEPGPSILTDVASKNSHCRFKPATGDLPETVLLSLNKANGKRHLED